jgi:hypothetical protein
MDHYQLFASTWAERHEDYLVVGSEDEVVLLDWPVVNPV